MRGHALGPALITALCLAAVGCNSASSYLMGRLYESLGKPLRAVSAYERYAEARPEDPRACQARLASGRIYSGLRRCLEARRHYEAAARGFAGLEPCAAKAKAGIMSCPDYFPLDKGRTWVFGDSASRGRAMRLDWELRLSSDSARASILGSLYAGNKRIQSTEVRYEKSDWALWEIRGEERFPLLRYPYTKGHSWTAGRGSDRRDFRIEDNDAEVKTAAGVFKGCVKVRERDRRFTDSWKYDYYAPFVGRVKTTIGGPGFENPNTELIKYGGG